MPTATGTRWVVKNLLEVKNGRGILIEGNLLEYSWAQDQKGYAILFTPPNNGSAPWTAVQDITFQYNTVQHVGAGMQIMGMDATRGSEYSRNIVVRHNLFDDVSTSWGGPAGFLVTGDGAQDVTIDHNTIIHTGFVVASAGEPNPGFAFTNNLAKHNQWGIYGNGHGAGFDSTNIYFTSDFDMRRNVMAGGAALEVSGRQLLSGDRRLPDAVREPVDWRLPSGARPARSRPRRPTARTSVSTSRGSRRSPGRRLVADNLIALPVTRLYAGRNRRLRGDRSAGRPVRRDRAVGRRGHG